MIHIRNLTEERENSKARKACGMLCLVSFIAFVVISVYICICFKGNIVLYDEPQEFNDGWVRESNRESNHLHLERTITPDMVGMTIRMFSYDAFIQASADSVVFYEYGVPYRFFFSPSSLYHLIEIPVNSEGKTLNIDIRAAYPQRYTPDYEMYIASKGDHIVSMFRNEILEILLSMLLVLMGISLVTLFIIESIYKLKDWGAILLGLIAIMFVIFANCDLFVNQLIFDNNNFCYMLYYFMIYTIPLLLFMYMETLSDRLNCSILYITHIITTTVLILLHMLHIYEATQTLPVYCIVSVAEVFILTVLTIRAGIRDMGITFYAFIVMGVTVLLNIVTYFTNIVKGTTMTIAKVGMCIYVGAALVNYIRRWSARMAEVRNSEMLREQAYTDALTGIGNRLAFNQAIDKADYRNIVLFSFDVNNLKYYNDHFGHLKGDQLIVRGAELLTDVFGDVYRTGGDEFMAIKTGMTEPEALGLRSKLSESAADASGADMIMEIACGYAMYRDGDRSCEDLMKRADQWMYEDKKLIKERSKIKTER